MLESNPTPEAKAGGAAGNGGSPSRVYVLRSATGRKLPPEGQAERGGAKSKASGRSTAPEGQPSLSKRTNSTESSQLTPYQARARFALSSNIQRAAIRYPDRSGFLTLTLGDWRNGRFRHVTDKREAARRWNSLRRHLVEWLGARQLVAVWERHNSGGWHVHAFVVVARDIRRGFDHDAVRGGDYRSAPKALKGYWQRLRRCLPAYGFGRHQLEPVKRPEAAGSYLAKYLGKGFWSASSLQTGEDSGQHQGLTKTRPASGRRGPSGRSLSYCGDWTGRTYARGWSWWGLGGRIHGHVVAAIEVALGGQVAVNAALRLAYGPRWCYYLRRWWEEHAEPAVIEAGEGREAEAFWAALMRSPIYGGLSRSRWARRLSRSVQWDWWDGEYHGDRLERLNNADTWAEIAGQLAKQRAMLSA